MPSSRKKTPPPADLILDDGAIHVWRTALDQPAGRVADLARTLSTDETARAQSFTYERGRIHFVVARGCLRAILSRYVDVEPLQLRFDYSPRGKPSLADGCGHDGLRFNVAHSGGIALFAVTRGREVGVDVECLRPLKDVEAIAARFFAPGERDALRALPPATRLEAFFNCWTRKEAYLKALGSGLAQALDTFEVSLAPGEPAGLIRVHGQPHEAARWTIQALEPATGYVGAVAAEGRGWHLACLTWPTEPGGRSTASGRAPRTRDDLTDLRKVRTAPRAR